MHLSKTFNSKTGRTYLSIVNSYREKGRKNPAHKTIRSLGYLDELQKEFDDPIAYFKQVAKDMTKQYEEAHQPIQIFVSGKEQIAPNTDNRMNLGYAAIVKIFHELKLNVFFQNKQRWQNFSYNTNSIMLLLVVSRLLSPATKKNTFENKARYFERFDFDLCDIYRSLTYFSQIDKQVQRHIHEQITAQYGRNTELVYYDVTNYYFEIDENDGDEIDENGKVIHKGLRKKGVCKEHRPNPITQMGLAMDAQGLPIAYRLYPGNTNDTLTLRPILKELKLNYNMGRVIVVADKGINSSDNIWYMKKDQDHDGYVISLSVRGSSEDFKKYVLDETGYCQKKKKADDGTVLNEADDGFKIKSRNDVRYIKVSKAGGGKMTKSVDEKQVIFYSKKYAEKAKAERAEVVAKAKDLCLNPGRYSKAASYGALKYVDGVDFDKDTGEILTQNGRCPIFNEAKLLEEEKYDGYYAIVTSETDKSDDWIIETYRGLWEIEESFKLTKSELEARPVFVSREEHINAHFLSCFIALVIARLLEKKLSYKYSLPQVIEALKKISCSLEEENIYLFDYRSAISEAIGDAIGVDFTRKRYRLGEIKNILSNCKK
jgi:transposase